MKKTSFKDFFKKNYLLVVSGVLTIGCSTAFAIRQYEFASHFIDATISDCYDTKKENTYVVVERTKFVDSTPFIKSLRELNRKKGIGYYIIDLSSYSEDDLKSINVSTEFLQYRVFDTKYTANNDGTVTESRYLLYTGLNYKKWNQMEAEINFVKKYGTVDQPYYLKNTSNLYMCYGTVEQGNVSSDTKMFAPTFYAYTIESEETISSDNFVAYVDENHDVEYKPQVSFSETISYAGSSYAVTVTPQFNVPIDSEMLEIVYKSSRTGESMTFKMDIATESCCRTDEE